MRKILEPVLMVRPMIRPTVQSMEPELVDVELLVLLRLLIQVKVGLLE